MRQSFNIRLPAGKVWPQYESEQTGGGRQIKRYNWIRIHNRGTVDLYVDTKGIPISNDLSEVWDVVAPGQLVVRNLGAFEDPEGWADELHIANIAGAAAAALALVEISDKPIVDIRSGPTPTGAISPLFSKVTLVDAFNGNAMIESWADGTTPPSGFLIGTEAWLKLFNGTTEDRARSASAANLAAQSGLGAALVAPPGQWSVQHSPAISAKASIVKAAGAAGVRHVCTGFGFGFSSAAAVAGALIQVNLRDGDTGAGAILKSWQFQLPAAIIPNFAIEVAGCEIVGSPATAMTMEFVALLANLLEFVNLSGHDAV